MGGDLAPSLGGRTKLSRTKLCEWPFFRTKFPFNTLKILMTLFTRRLNSTVFFLQAYFLSSMTGDPPPFFPKNTGDPPFLHQKHFMYSNSNSLIWESSISAYFTWQLIFQRTVIKDLVRAYVASFRQFISRLQHGTLSVSIIIISWRFFVCLGVQTLPLTLNS